MRSCPDTDIDPDFVLMRSLGDITIYKKLTSDTCLTERRTR